jgi:hypothetical protein
MIKYQNITKMKKLLFPLLFISSWLNAQDDITLSGVVVLQNSKYNTGEVIYLKNVTVISRVGSQKISDLTDSDGDFDLVFSDKPYGNVARIYARKNAYEVVNYKELEQATVLGRYQPLKIVMCKQGDLAANQVRYYGIAVEAINERYEKKVALIGQEGAEKEALLEELRRKYNQYIVDKSSIIYYLEKDKENALKQARQISERFAEVNLDDADSLYIPAYEAFLDKRFDDVYKILDLERLRKNMEAARALMKQGEDLIAYADSVKAYNEAMLSSFITGSLMSANAAIKKDAIDKAILYYEQIIRNDSTNLATLYEFAQFLDAYDTSDKIITVLDQSYKALQETHDRVYIDLFTKFVTDKLLKTIDFGQRQELELLQSRFQKLKNN